jgi:hypothetical protein
VIDMPESTEQKTELVIKVAKVRDEYCLVLNKGSNDNLKVGQRFLIYSIGEEIIDPDTQKSLGQLEIVKGTGKITHLQPTMSTIQSDMKTSPSKTIRRIKKQDPFGLGRLSSVLGTNEVVEETLPTEAVPFENPVVNDLAKPI